MSRADERLVDGWQDGFGPTASRVLSVAAGGYRGLLGTRDWLYTLGVLKSHRLGCPVVSIGNLTVGGTGKTPAVELAVRTLIELDHRPAVVSRGYGRRTHGIQIVADAASIRLDAEEGGDEPFLLARRLPGVLSRGYGRRSSGVQIVADAASIRLDAEEAGDEPFLLARRLPGVPVVVGPNRYEAGRVARARFGVTAIVLDDGFQHRTLAKDVEIVMARARAPWGNGRLLPGGPLREPLSALGRAALIVVTGADGPHDVAEVAEAARRHAPGTPVLAARHVPTECWEVGSMKEQPLTSLLGKRLFGFAGIGSPDGFRRTLAETGVIETGFARFADHHWYTREDLRDLDAAAAARGADGLVTTEKDWVRLRRLPVTRRPIYALGVRLVLLSGEAAWRSAFTASAAHRA
ncbi:MAG TPA: tetraacyldisaccharide 4'-kinase [Methylomirabilota bacterium]|nr:tetraacyldisaccharide 4'-kinase [Methylomirabilota bacterium]